MTPKIINDNFIAVKVDRDERPDIDSRYQAAVSAVSGKAVGRLRAFSRRMASRFLRHVLPSRRATWASQFSPGVAFP